MKKTLISDDRLKLHDSLSIQLKSPMWNHFKLLMQDHMYLAKEAFLQRRRETRRRHTSAVIIFSTFLLESFINDMLIEYFKISEEQIKQKDRNEGRDIFTIFKFYFTRKRSKLKDWQRIEMMNLPNKWRRAFRLLTGKRLKDKLYKEISWLNDLRNTLAHNKPTFETLNNDKATTTLGEILENNETSIRAYKIAQIVLNNYFTNMGLDIPDTLYNFLQENEINTIKPN